MRNSLIFILFFVAVSYANTVFTLEDFANVGVSPQRITNINDIRLEELRREKNGLWAGAILSAFVGGIFIGVSEGEAGLLITGAAFATGASVMTYSAAVRTAVYERARWEVRHDFLFGGRNRNRTARQSQVMRQSELRESDIRHRQLQQQLQHRDVEITTSPAEAQRQAEHRREQEELRQRWQEQQRKNLN
ncbi:MAG: hypothetical protein FWE23_08925 [Chitinivibrionia bacterium]|nr:hypothetical protein [Chitinivibrionia bacterium]